MGNLFIIYTNLRTFILYPPLSHILLTPVLLVHPHGITLPLSSPPLVKIK